MAKNERFVEIFIENRCSSQPNRTRSLKSLATSVPFVNSKQLFDLFEAFSAMLTKFSQFTRAREPCGLLATEHKATGESTKP